MTSHNEPSPPPSRRIAYSLGTIEQIEGSKSELDNSETLVSLPGGYSADPSSVIYMHGAKSLRSRDEFSIVER